jgi:hypothetical protein
MPLLIASCIQERNSWWLRTRTIFRKACEPRMDGLHLSPEVQKLIEIVTLARQQPA